jgi:hypothetical protein
MRFIALISLLFVAGCASVDPNRPPLIPVWQYSTPDPEFFTPYGLYLLDFNW